jgi:predicted RND superfamily exporter protein
MSKIFLMQPRQSGKTTKAMYEFAKDPENTIFVTHNFDMVKHIHNRIGGNIKNFTSANQFHNKIIGRRPKNIILDEYMFFKNRDEIYKEIQIIQPDNVYIFSTSDKCYDKKIFDYVKENKRTLSYQDLLTRYGDKLTEYIERQIYELYYNFLTDDDTILIDVDFSGNMRDRSDFIAILGKEKYRTEIINSYLK